MLVHVNTGMHLTAITQETVRLQPSLGSGAYFLVLTLTLTLTPP